MNPFFYPKVLHARRFTPKLYKRYQSYKRLLRIEFEGKCVYCKMPASLKGNEAFGVDHYRPKRLFPARECDYSNLYYCCNSCNSAKGSYWPSTAAKELVEFIPNPCDHRMFENLRFVGATVQWKTQAGKIAVELLDLNDPDATGYREFVISAIAIAEKHRDQLLTQRAEIGRKLKSGGMSEGDAATADSEVVDELAKVDRVLKRFYGLV